MYEVMFKGEKTNLYVENTSISIKELKKFIPEIKEYVRKDRKRSEVSGDVGFGKLLRKVHFRQLMPKEVDVIMKTAERDLEIFKA